ncbi:MAG: hypothetical protein JNN15_16490 [Blastocatellia bacterium]|nr:hypothetical protein [Blastocatellia bacterium]
MILIIDSSSMEIVSSSKLGREIDTNILPSGRGDQVFFVLSDGQLWTTSLVTFESKPFGNTRGLIINSVATTDKYTAVAHGSGFAVFDQYGTQMWETSLDANSIVASPLISNDNCWIVDDTGVMFFFNLFDSVPRLRKRVFENTFALTPVLTDKHVIFSSRLGEIRAYLI